MKKFVSLLLALVTCLSLAAPAFAAEDATEEHIWAEELTMYNLSPGFDKAYYDGAGNLFSPAVFATLTDAKIAFGYNRTYTQCYKSDSGHSFNCCYAFDDGSKCYFNVKDFWK